MINGLVLSMNNVKNVSMFPFDPKVVKVKSVLMYPMSPRSGVTPNLPSPMFCCLCNKSTCTVNLPLSCSPPDKTCPNQHYNKNTPPNHPNPESPK